ncbi:MAG: hypothetical protein AAGD14_13275 [Planctomycetota bacterium]
MLLALPVDFWWWLPFIAVTGWILGYVHFRDSMHRKHPDLFEEWRRRTEAAKAEKKQKREDASS